MASLRSKPVAIAGIGLILVAALGLWGYGAYTKSQARKAATALVKDTAERLREAFLLEAEGRPTTAEAVTRMEAYVAAIQRNYTGLRRLDRDGLGGLADAADNYFVTSHEILRRIAISNRARLSLAGSSGVLHSHMRSDRGEASWPREAVQLRERVDRHYRDYRLAAEALVKLIDSFAASQTRIAPYVEPALLIEPDAVASARAALVETTARLATEIGTLTNLEAYR